MRNSSSGPEKPANPSSIWTTITTYARLLFHPDTSWTVKGILGLAIIYLLSPFDLIPEWLGALGLIDDLAIVTLLVGWAIRLAERRNQGRTTKTK